MSKHNSFSHAARSRKSCIAILHETMRCFHETSARPSKCAGVYQCTDFEFKRDTRRSDVGTHQTALQIFAMLLDAPILACLVHSEVDVPRATAEAFITLRQAIKRRP